MQKYFHLENLVFQRSTSFSLDSIRNFLFEHEKLAFLKLGYVISSFKPAQKIFCWDFFGQDCLICTASRVQKEFYLKNCFLGGKYNKFFLWIEKSFGARISLDGYARLFHFRLLLRIILTDTKLSSHFKISKMIQINNTHITQFILVGVCPRLVLIAIQEEQIGIFLKMLWITLVETPRCISSGTIYKVHMHE